MMDKAFEELKEFEQEVAKMDKEKMLGEFGDLLFAFVNIARYYKLIQKRHFVPQMRNSCADLYTWKPK